MVARSNLPKNIRKHIRSEKSRIRREFLDKPKQEEEIKKLYEKLNIGYIIKKDPFVR